MPSPRRGEGMPKYSLVYYSGANMHLRRTSPEVVEAASLAEALARRTDWPVFEARDHCSATAENPGGTVYFTEMWEAVLLEPALADTQSGYCGDFAHMRY